MAETDAAVTNPTAPGPITSEFKIAKFAAIAGAVLEALALLIHSFQLGGINATWMATVLAVVGALLPIATALGYQSSRARVKASQIQADAAQVIAETQAAAPKPASAAAASTIRP